MFSASPLILIEGPSGSGKTTLATELQRHLQVSFDLEVAVLHLEDLYAGWGGLAHGSATTSQLIADRAAGKTLHWQSYDWASEQFGQWHELAPEHPLIVEGCGALTAETAQHAEIRIWLDAPAHLRQERAFSRGGENYEAHWTQWDEQYDEFVATHKPRAFANVTRVATR